MQRSLVDYLKISLKGMAMGAADVVPGVSGGTIAFISGIYEELITTISSHLLYIPGILLPFEVVIHPHMITFRFLYVLSV